MDAVVELQSGFMQGVVEKHEDGFNYYSFKGIPYAEPPVGELRFKDPVPKKKWTGILECQNYGSPAVQYDIFLNEDFYSEDSLNLNVFTRRINEPNANKPVIVWLHGGEFNFGSSNDVYAGPNYLIRKDIVLVTVNYRLGVLGFLNLEDDIAPGNQGLKDQIMALNWIQQNIKIFGGNSENVTVGGITAGAVSAHCLALSPLAKGLFHRIICMGGVLYNYWPTIKNPKQSAMDLCKFLGKTLEDSQEIVHFLQKVEIKELHEAQKRLRPTLIVPFGPGADSQSANAVFPVDRFLSADQGVHLPCLVGYTNREGILGLFGNNTKGMPRRDYFEMCDKDFRKIFISPGENLLSRYDLNEAQIRRLYYKSEEVSETNLERYVGLQSEVNFIEGVHRFARVQAQKSSAPTYLYRFDFESPNALKNVFIKDAPKGANHMDDLPYVFKLDFFGKNSISHKKGTQDYKIMEQMTEMFVNFATHGRPTIEVSELIPVHWKPLANGTFLRHIIIDEDLTMGCSINMEQKFRAAKQIKA